MEFCLPDNLTAPDITQESEYSFWGSHLVSKRIIEQTRQKAWEHVS